jgi:uncharacterized RDD family membrane protein YckC
VTLRAPAPVAPLGRRLIAFIFDGFVLVPVYVTLAVVLDGLFGQLVAPGPDGSGLVVVAVNPPRVALELAITLLVDAAYYAGSWTRWGMTLGQRAFGVAVRAVGPGMPPPGGPPALPPDPARVPLQVATTRWAVLELLPLCMGTLGAAGALPIEVVGGINSGWFAFLFVTALADPLRRAFHDRVAGTVVVRPVLRLRR